jgi:hypothetical protein
MDLGTSVRRRWDISVDQAVLRRVKASRLPSANLPCLPIISICLRRKIDHVDQLGSLYLGGFHCRHGLLDVLEFEPRTLHRRTSLRERTLT